MFPKIGIMQGRLSKPLDDKIQSFPVNTWEKEFYLAKDIGFKTIEWVLDDNLKSNPILNKESFSKITAIKNETNIDVNSICCDYFMKNSLSSHSKSFKRENLEILNILIEKSKSLLFDSSSKLKNEITKLNKTIYYVKEKGSVKHKIVEQLENLINLT